MGERKASSTLPRGVTVRENRTGSSIQIAFQFRGVQCRETLPLPPTVANIRYAGNLKAEIDRKIRAETFRYADYFPNSPKAGTAPGRKRVLMGDLLELRRKAYQSAVKNDNLSPSTLVGYEKAIDRLLKDWDKIQLQDATPSFLRTWIGNLNITSKGVRNMLTPLRSAFEDALNDGLIEHDPFTKIALKKLLRETAKKSEYRADPFDAEERAALIAKARDDERPMVQFWFESGLRPGEIIALAWPKIDWIHHRARIDLNVVAKVEKAPKTAAGLRDLDLSQNALSALTAQKAHTFLAGGRVFHNPRTAEPWEAEPQIRKTFWEPLCKRAGVRYRSPYQVRHTFASVLLGQGHNPWYVAQQMGHEDIDMIFEVYGHWIADSFKKPRLERQITRESHAPAEADATALIHKVKG